MAVKGTKGKRGFALLDPEKQREIARLGGQTVQRLGKGHTFTPEEAREAGKKGGPAVSRDRVHMAEIGRRGGVSPRRQRAKAKDNNRKET
jgi:general stress protein YciG